MSHSENQADPKLVPPLNELIMVRKYLMDRQASHSGTIATLIDRVIYIIDSMLPIHSLGPWAGAHQELRISVAGISVDIENLIKKHTVPWITDLGFLQEIVNLLKPYCEPKVEFDSVMDLLKGLGRMQFYWSNNNAEQGKDPQGSERTEGIA